MLLPSLIWFSKQLSISWETADRYLFISVIVINLNDVDRTDVAYLLTKKQESSIGTTFTYAIFITYWVN